MNPKRGMSTERRGETENMKKKLIGFYDYTVILTYCGMLFAFFGTLKAIKGAYGAAALSLMLAGVCDLFDGTVASTKNRNQNEKRFGTQIDSLSDLVSFGVLPGIFVYMICGKYAPVGLISTLFVLSALIRLAYFNVLEEDRQSRPTENPGSYLGVPVTNIAILLPACFLLYEHGVIKSALCFPILLLLTGVGFLMPVEFKKPGKAWKTFVVLVGIFEAACMILFMWREMM